MSSDKQKKAKAAARPSHFAARENLIAALTARDEVALKGAIAAVDEVRHPFVWVPAFSWGHFYNVDTVATLLLASPARPAETVAAFENALLVGSIPAYLVIAVRGLNLNSPYEAGGFIFQPFQTADHRWAPTSVGVDLRPMHMPSGFIAVSKVNTPVLLGERSGEEEQRILESLNARSHALVDDLLNRLSVATRLPANRAGWWHVRHEDDHLWKALPNICIHALNVSLEGILVAGNLTHANIDQAMAYRDGEVADCRFALNRYRRAMSEIQQFEDPAADAAICLESMIMGGEKAEITEQLSLRTAHLLGGDASQRRRTYDIVRRTYGTRSKIVHGGSSRKGERDLAQETQDAIELCGQAAHKILTEGCPDQDEWRRMLLGSDPTTSPRE